MWNHGMIDGAYGEFVTKSFSVFGPWKKNKLHGYGYQFFEDGKLFYEGEWDNGMKLGEGKTYKRTGDVAYQGYLKEK